MLALRFGFRACAMLMAFSVSRVSLLGGENTQPAADFERPCRPR